MSTKTSLCAINVAFLLAVSVLSQAAAQDSPTPKSATSPTSKPRKVTRLTEEEARTQLQEGMPTWIPEDIRRSPEPFVWEAPARPREFAMKFVDEEFSFAGRRLGRDVYWSADRTVSVTADEVRGLFSLLRDPDESSRDTTKFTLEQAEEAAQEIYRAAAGSEIEQGAVIKTDVMQASPNEKPEVIARHVRFHRSANGLRVRDSVWMVTFDLLGNPFRIEAKWPQFKLSTVSELKSKEEALKVLETELVARSRSEVGVSHIELDLAYEAVQDGVFEPIISLWTFPGDGIGSPEEIQFSLVSGLRPLAVEDKADPHTDS